MIAIVTSSIYPVMVIDNVLRSHISLKEREVQTIEGIIKLLKVGFEQVIIVDNSVQPYDFSAIKSLSNKITVIQLKQHQFQNKGINELLMLLTILDEVPEDKAIFKISARYFPIHSFTCELSSSDDFKIKGYDFYERKGTISTRAYFVKNKVIYKDFLLQTLNEVFLYPQRIVGARSLINLFYSIFKPKFKTQFNTSIEFAGARVLKSNKYKIKLVDSIGIEGVIAGSNSNSKIEE